MAITAGDIAQLYAARPGANPRLVFEGLFGAGAPGERAANLERRKEEERSVLDFGRDEARSLAAELAGRDWAKLDEYLTSVREIEGRMFFYINSGWGSVVVVDGEM